MTTERPTNERHISIEKTEGVGWEFEAEQGSSGISGTLEYMDAFQGWLSRVPAFGTAHPDIPELKLTKFKGSRTEGGLVRVSLTYAGNDSEAEYPGRDPNGKTKRYHIEPGGGEEPLVTNKLFRDMPEAEKESALELVSSGKTKEDFTKAANNLTSAAGLKLIEKVRKGIDAYRGLGVIWVEKFRTKTLADVELTKIFKTTNQPPGGCPEAGANYNWLRLPPGVSPLDDGETWDLENRWELSLYGKWDPDIYPPGG